jgi:hypothetical protein
MDRLIRLIGAVWLLVSAPFVPQAVAANLESGEFTFEDVFSTRSQTERFSFHGYAAFQYFDSQGLAAGRNGASISIFEPFFGYQVNERVFTKSSSSSNTRRNGLMTTSCRDLHRTSGNRRDRGTHDLAFGAILVPFGLNYTFTRHRTIQLVTIAAHRQGWRQRQLDLEQHVDGRRDPAHPTA